MLQTAVFGSKVALEFMLSSVYYGVLINNKNNNNFPTENENNEWGDLERLH